jgi:hypothetical protein
MSEELVTLFISYSHKDEALRRELDNHLKPLIREKVIEAWHDRQIDAGKVWPKEIEEKLNKADMILLLISSDFVASDYCNTIEMEQALQRHEKGEAIIVPVILRTCDWENEKFAKFQAFPTDAKAITAWEDKDAAFTDVARGIRQVAKNLYTKRKQKIEQKNAAQAEDKAKVEEPSQYNKIEEAPKTTSIDTAKNVDCPYGLFYYGPRKSLRHEDVFQDFVIVRNVPQGNVNAVQWLWADTRAGSTISASVVNGEPPHLQISFHTAKDSYPGNIAIRGKNESPLKRGKSKRFLVFGVRAREKHKEGTAKIAVAVRIVNGQLQHWVYGSGSSAYACKVLDDLEWTRVCIDLENRDPSCWWRFESDGNPEGSNEPNFSCICSVILEVGRMGKERPDSPGNPKNRS